jgi:glycosyltransferase involved in cell wall biosynthesis
VPSRSDRPLTIWILNHYAHPRDVPGSSRHHDLAVELVRRGNQVVVVSSSFDHFSHKYVRKVPSTGSLTELVDGITWVWVSTSAYFGNDAKRIMSMFQYERRAKTVAMRLLRLHRLPSPDVIIGSTVHPLAARAGATLARALCVPFVLEVRDLWPETLIDMGVVRREGLLGRLLAGIEKSLCRRSSGIILVPDNAGDYYSQRGVPSEKLIWIPNAVDLERYAAHDIGSRTQSGSFEVVYTGALGVNDGMRNAIEAWMILEGDGYSDIHLSLYGDGNEKAALMQLAQSRSLASVSFRDRVPKDQVPAILSSADAALMCLLSLPMYRYGASPNKLGDYMAAGKPIVYSSDYPIAALVSSGCAIRCAASNPRALASAVLDMRATSETDRFRMGQAAKAYVLHVLGIREVGGRLEAGLRRVVEGHAIADGVVSTISADCGN